MITENRMQAPNGLVVLLALIAVTGVLVYAIVADIRDNFQIGFLGLICILSLPVVGFLCAGFFTVNPNEGRVLQFFGRYIGTVQDPGLRWANPFYTKERVSLRVRNFETSKLKVNDNRGNPIEIAAVVVWKVIDTAEAVFEVDDYINYVHVQSEAAVQEAVVAAEAEARAQGEEERAAHQRELEEQQQD